ncbi:unnamed protein product [Darwinula stevensoni]|uniref:Histone-lysine N-methyltransferase n=1 Tax=Darwinula stevensoni TaxID=69355 RepID=A0A7R9FRT5_9CRUS|nr:unnamed protein product [Darwinula stevensoni]CAG0902080.1 unnamed protein product [Darwinula stevensoni]
MVTMNNTLEEGDEGLSIGPNGSASPKKVDRTGPKPSSPALDVDQAGADELKEASEQDKPGLESILHEDNDSDDSDEDKLVIHSDLEGADHVRPRPSRKGHAKPVRSEQVSPRRSTNFTSPRRRQRGQVKKPEPLEEQCHGAAPNIPVDEENSGHGPVDPALNETGSPQSAFQESHGRMGSSKEQVCEVVNYRKVQRNQVLEQSQEGNESAGAGVVMKPSERYARRKTLDNSQLAQEEGKSRYGRVRKPKTDDDFIVGKPAHQVIGQGLSRGSVVPEDVASGGRKRSVSQGRRGSKVQREEVGSNPTLAEPVTPVVHRPRPFRSSTGQSLNNGPDKTERQDAEKCPENHEDSLNDSQDIFNSEEDDVDALHHSPGDLVWSRLQGYPYWPSLICRDPADDTYMRFRGPIGRDTQNTQLFHVYFLGDRGRHNWVSAKPMLPYEGLSKLHKKKQEEQDKLPGHAGGRWAKAKRKGKGKGKKFGVNQAQISLKKAFTIPPRLTQFFSEGVDEADRMIHLSRILIQDFELKKAANYSDREDRLKTLRKYIAKPKRRQSERPSSPESEYPPEVITSNDVDASPKKQRRKKSSVVNPEISETPSDSAQVLLAKRPERRHTHHGILTSDGATNPVKEASEDSQPLVPKDQEVQPPDDEKFEVFRRCHWSDTVKIFQDFPEEEVFQYLVNKWKNMSKKERMAYVHGGSIESAGEEKENKIGKGNRRKSSLGAPKHRVLREIASPEDGESESNSDADSVFKSQKVSVNRLEKVCHICEKVIENVVDMVKCKGVCCRTFHSGCIQTNGEDYKCPSCEVDRPPCFICKNDEGGSLVCCETCPASFHVDCLPYTPDEGNFFCEDCESGKMPLYGDVVWVKVGNYRWWPGRVIHESVLPRNVANLPHQHGDFPVFFFGSKDFYWVNRGRVFLYEEGDSAGVRGKNSSALEKAFDTAVVEARDMFEKRRIEKALYASKMSEKLLQKPPPYVKLKTNKPVGKVKVIEVDPSTLTPCDCDPNDAAPCTDSCINRMLLMECHPAVCRAGPKCRNQRFQKREYPPLRPYLTEGRGWGLQALAPIPKGEFVIEYVGELIDEKEYQQRMALKHRTKDENYYFLTIEKDRIIDAGPKGNHARFINHSCQPNCETQKWTVSGDTRVGLFANQDIPALAELTFNYNLVAFCAEKKMCQCGAPNCSGYIGVKSKVSEAILDEKGKGNGVRGRRRKKGEENGKRKPRKKFESECFRCGEPGELLLCDYRSCPKAYHLVCLQLDVSPHGKWWCPWHHCDECGGRAINLCNFCPSSFCAEHSEGNITQVPPLGMVCGEHDNEEVQELKNYLDEHPEEAAKDKEDCPMQPDSDPPSASDAETSDAEPPTPKAKGTRKRQATGHSGRGRRKRRRKSHP